MSKAPLISSNESVKFWKSCCFARLMKAAGLMRVTANHSREILLIITCMRQEVQCLMKSGEFNVMKLEENLM